MTTMKTKAQMNWEVGKEMEELLQSKITLETSNKWIEIADVEKTIKNVRNPYKKDSREFKVWNGCIKIVQQSIRNLNSQQLKEIHSSSADKQGSSDNSNSPKTDLKQNPVLCSLCGKTKDEHKQFIDGYYYCSNGKKFTPKQAEEKHENIK